VLLAAAMHLVVAETASAKLEPVQGAGLKTRAEIREFQRGHGLKADGIMGPDTRFALRTVPHGHARVPRAATDGSGLRLAAAPRAPSASRHGGIEYLAMFAGGWAILVALAVLKLREPVSYRARVLRDSFRRPSGHPASGVRWLPSGAMFAEGRAARGGIGRFRGSVSAVTELRGERCFLVQDRRRPRGVWVFESEIQAVDEADDRQPAGRLP